MEDRGKVNQYDCWTDPKKRFFTLNLAVGVTPFIHFLNGEEYRSNMYRVMVPKVTITQVHYRPDRTTFDAAPQLQEHILNGGLVLAPFGVKILQAENDPVTLATGYETFQRWAANYYGKRLPPEGG